MLLDNRIANQTNQGGGDQLPPVSKGRNMNWSREVRDMGGIPKALCRTWAEVAAHPLVDFISDEGSEGKWVYLIKGWWIPLLEHGSIHEHTLAAVAALLQTAEPQQVLTTS